VKCRLTQDPWPAVDDLDRLVYLATSPEPLFIYAATLCRFVYDEKHPRDPRKQLKLWLKQGQENRSQLHQIYDPILTQVFPGDEEAGYGQQLQFLGALVLLATPLPVVSFSCLLGTDMDDINWWLPELHAVLDIPTEPYGPIRSLHKSFSDFLLNPVDQGAHKYRVDAADTHAMLTMKCIQRMQAGLKRDICNIQKLDASRDKIEQGNINKCIPFDLQYACLYWIHHLQGSKRSMDSDIHKFLCTHFLHWVEALSILGRLSEGAFGLEKLLGIVEVSTVVSLLKTSSG
jgi:hypothetical protein